jgi:2-polyprenyl-3-methyl-5-hydroxy-6-metoxy-1,4-benzoquinol methylase
MRKATDVFGEWAEQGKDRGMEDSHAIPVNEMISFALQEREKIGKKFSFLDLGCGNGWVVRDVINNTLCNQALGVDGAEQMIANAELRGGDAEYILANINSFNLPEKYDVIHSMEVLYYLEDPSAIVQKISESWLNRGGRLIVGIDHYFENRDSHSWQEKVGTRMLMLKESEWIKIFEMAGFVEVKSWRSNKNKDWAGTLVITGKK